MEQQPGPTAREAGTASAIAGLRVRYSRGHLAEADLAPEPMTQFRAWLAAAVESAQPEPNAMTLATVDALGHPAARTVLLKGLDDGFVFFTNLESRKGRHLLARPYGALVFCWLGLERQVTARGAVAPVTRAESAAYFRSRPHESQVGAWASRQSQVIGSRAELEARAAAVAERFADGAVPVPDFWGGFRLVPDEVEFWQGRAGRLHDRLRYDRTDHGWAVSRLEP